MKESRSWRESMQEQVRERRRGKDVREGTCIWQNQCAFSLGITWVEPGALEKVLICYLVVSTDQARPDPRDYPN